jgi:hypothetical protein
MSRPEPLTGFGIEQVREWTPLSAPLAVVVLVHGIAEHSGRYERTGSLLSDAGFLVRSIWSASGRRAVRVVTSLNGACTTTR